MNEEYRQALIAGEQAGMRYSLTIPRQAAVGSLGWHLGFSAGSSLEFKDHREYQPGDDPRRIDWNAFARTDKPIIKLYREEVSPHLDLVIDGSRSMALAESAKAQAALGLAAIFAVAAANAGYSRTAWVARGQCLKVENSHDLPSRWAGLDFDYRGNPADSFMQAAPMWRRQGVRVLLSDLLWLCEPLLVLQHLARGATAVIVVQVLAEADIAPAARGRLRLVDTETQEQREIVVDDAAIKRYRAALSRHEQNWHRACRQAGAVMTQVIAEQVVDGWNLSELAAAEILKAS